MPDPAPPPPPASLPASPRPRQGLAPGPQGRLVRIACILYGLIAVFSLGFALFSKQIHVFFGETYPSPAELLIGLFTGLTVVAACQIGVRVWKPVTRAADALADLVGPLTYGAALVLALASGIGEELLFRGALWHALGFWGTSILFGVVHFVPKRALLGYPLFALGGGLVFGLLRELTHNVIPAMAAHVTVNAVNLGWLEWRRRRGSAPATRA